MSASLPLLRVWMGDKYVPYDSLSEEDKARVKEWVSATWKEATNRHIKSLLNRANCTRKEAVTDKSQTNKWPERPSTTTKQPS